MQLCRHVTTLPGASDIFSGPVARGSLMTLDVLGARPPLPPSLIVDGRQDGQLLARSR
jgi:hypothetical protein